MLSRKTFMQLHLFILHGVMLHIDGICYALHDAMLCNERLLMQDDDAWPGFGYIQLCMVWCILQIENLGYQ